eukprot:m.146181 g.146181  ORF g.146181 m.146181 type:complete len:74 (-) comp23094_c0_seq3:282-503(-)
MHTHCQVLVLTECMQRGVNVGKKEKREKGNDEHHADQTVEDGTRVQCSANPRTPLRFQPGGYTACHGLYRGTR